MLGHRSDEIRAHLEATPEGKGTQFVLNPRYPEGMLTSVQAGAAAAPADTDWFAIALADQPSLQSEVVTLLLAEAAKGGATLLVPSYDSRRGHPLLIHARHREEIAALDPALGLRELMRRHPDQLRHVVVPTDTVLHDMDTPEDYQRELKRLASSETPADESGTG